MLSVMTEQTLESENLVSRKTLNATEPGGILPSDDKAMIGNEVRFWRKERGLTGAALARRAEITAGMLTKIELGKVAPSISTLLSIADALNVPISMFFHRIEKSRYVSFVPAEQRMKVDKRGARAGHLYEMLGHNTGKSIAIEPFFVRYDSEAEPYSTFQEEGYKFIYMMSGHIIYRHGERHFPLKPGDTLIFDAMAPHGPLELVELPSTLLSVAISSSYDPGMR